MLPLAGIRVVDLSTVVMGPYASQWLADLGAEVIKVEPPEGDSTRRTGPAAEPGMSAIFLGVNRSKRSVVLDLKQPAAQAALERVLAGADVLMHSMRPQKLAALGLAPDAVRARHPDLVFVSLLGFAEDGPYGGRPAYDDIIQGLSGNAALMAAQTGDSRYFPTIAADKTSGLVAALSVCAALAGRARRQAEGSAGAGTLVEVPMFESMVAFNLVEHFYGHHFEPPRGPSGYPRVLAPLRRPYRSADGHVCMMPYTDAHWRDFFHAAGRPELAADARFADIAARTEHIETLYELTGEIVQAHSTAHWVALCKRLQIPVARINALDDLQDDPHLAATGFFETAEDPAMGTLRFPGAPVRFDGQRAPLAVPPRLGEHTRDVLAQAGLGADEIEQLQRSGAVRCATARETP
ncbi:crotonobetainyl-CoA:carnitine CoA-transferase CaiB-like acyl-CoA transferase [Cupriavidus alkaliphilus]|uniref:CaiB/BaiF CoA transferase family protein n=1 Tax=Cupriavidus alkaliphilus TaxID=942866 RepID=UPI000DE67CCE|nr:CoA transferase [Cupriavidus alkaliphilus]PVY80036.1 crotonobetainyl-CoA:carnitine CoA-transferase CaiB-like acyl-CoA transferase [Cupriavidus alkaliphilus]